MLAWRAITRAFTDINGAMAFTWALLWRSFFCPSACLDLESLSGPSSPSSPAHQWRIITLKASASICNNSLNQKDVSSAYPALCKVLTCLQKRPVGSFPLQISPCTLQNNKVLPLFVGPNQAYFLLCIFIAVYACFCFLPLISFAFLP